MECMDILNFIAIISSIIIGVIIGAGIADLYIWVRKRCK